MKFKKYSILVVCFTLLAIVRLASAETKLESCDSKVRLVTPPEVHLDPKETAHTLRGLVFANDEPELCQPVFQLKDPGSNETWPVKV